MVGKPAIGRLQETDLEFEASLGYMTVVFFKCLAVATADCQKVRSLSEETHRTTAPATVGCSLLGELTLLTVKNQREWNWSSAQRLHEGSRRPTNEKSLPQRELVVHDLWKLWV